MADALDSVMSEPRRSSRNKRKVIEYAAEDSQSGNDLVKPANPEPSRKLRKVTRGKIAVPHDHPHSGMPLDTQAMTLPTKDKSLVMAEVKQSESEATTKGKGKKKTASKGEEKRLKRFRDKMPSSASTTMERALSQRMYIVERKRHANPDCPHSTSECPIEIIDLAGTTGNIYTVTISHVPTCSCPNFIKGNAQCKHILYVLVRVLKAPENLQYQLAFLTSELHEIFDNAGPLPTDTASAHDTDGKRKPIEGDCPICVEDLVPESEAIVWCQAACGNNLHKTCFDQWAASKGHNKVTCPYCRTPWQAGVDEQALKNVDRAAAVNSEGYVNIAGQLGLSGQRDYSSYHGFWVRQEYKASRIDDEQAGDHLEWYDEANDRYRRARR